MEKPLQQRIVGAIVLVMLGVIFIPALLDGSGYKSRQVQDIPVMEKPAFPSLTQKNLKSISTPLEGNKQSVAENLKTDPRKSDKKPIKSFALQIGTFETYENAKKMRDRLRRAGYTTFVQESQANGNTRYKVRIGPELEYSVLDKINAAVKKSHKIDAYIVNHP